MRIKHLNGFYYLLKGFRYLGHARLRWFSFGPVLLNLLILIILYSVGGYYFHQWILLLNTHLPEWLRWLDVLFWFLYIGLALLLSAFIFSFVTNLIGTPLYSFLSGAVQREQQGPKQPQKSWHQVFCDLPKMLQRQLQILFAYLVPTIILFVLSWIPVLNIIIAILWFVFGAKMQAIQFLDYPLDNNDHTYEDVKRFYSQFRFSCLTFGTGVMIGMMVPILNLFVVPAAVAGATLMWLDYCNAVKEAQESKEAMVKT